MILENSGRDFNQTWYKYRIYNDGIMWAGAYRSTSRRRKVPLWLCTRSNGRNGVATYTRVDNHGHTCEKTLNIATKLWGSAVISRNTLCTSDVATMATLFSPHSAGHVFGTTRPGFEPPISQTRSGHSYTT